MHLILPKARPVLIGIPLESLPLFFLAGPVQGGGDWQKDMSTMLAKAVGDCLIVNPCRYDPWHAQYWQKLDGPTVDERQTDWERYYLEQAARDWHSGCIVFWLPEQPAARDDGAPYATDTRGELGEWRGRMMHDPDLRVVVGAEKCFPRLDVIERNFELALGSAFRIHETMEETVRAAARYAQRDSSFSKHVSA